MNRTYLIHNQNRFSEIVSKLSVLISWFLGLILGCYTVYSSSAVFLSWMNGIDIQPVSIVGRYLILNLSFIISVICIYLKLPLITLPIIFCKAFCFAYSLTFLAAIFGSSAWLVQGLLLFYELSTVSVLIYFWLNCTAGKRRCIQRNGIYFSVYSTIVMFVDYWVISPHTLTLFNHS